MELVEIRETYKNVGVGDGVSGRGLFAAEDVMEGEYVMEYVGERISMDEADRREGRDRDASRYMFKLESVQVVIDGNVTGGLAKLVNHSCEPNMEAVEIKLGDGYPILLYKAIRDIRRLEELTVDYNWSNGASDIPVVCECGSNDCRGIIGYYDSNE